MIKMVGVDGYEVPDEHRHKTKDEKEEAKKQRKDALKDLSQYDMLRKKIGFHKERYERRKKVNY